MNTPLITTVLVLLRECLVDFFLISYLLNCSCKLFFPCLNRSWLDLITVSLFKLQELITWRFFKYFSNRLVGLQEITNFHLLCLSIYFSFTQHFRCFYILKKTGNTTNSVNVSRQLRLRTRPSPNVLNALNSFIHSLPFRSFATSEWTTLTAL